MCDADCGVPLVSTYSPIHRDYILISLIKISEYSPDDDDKYPRKFGRIKFNVNENLVLLNF